MSDNTENGAGGPAPDDAVTENPSAGVAPTAGPAQPAATTPSAPVAAPAPPPAGFAGPTRTAVQAPRWLVIVVAIIAGLLLLGIGFGAGVAVAGHGDRGGIGTQDDGWQGRPDRGHEDRQGLPDGRRGADDRGSGDRGGSGPTAPTPTPESSDGS